MTVTGCLADAGLGPRSSYHCNAAGEAFNFIVQYSDGSIYQGRVYAQLLSEATQEVLRDLPKFPGDPVPVRLQVEMKLG